MSYDIEWNPTSLDDYTKGPCGSTCCYVFCFGRIDNFLGWQCSHGTWCIPKPLYPNHTGVKQPMMISYNRSWAELIDQEEEEDKMAAEAEAIEANEKAEAKAKNTILSTLPTMSKRKQKKSRWLNKE